MLRGPAAAARQQQQNKAAAAATAGAWRGQGGPPPRRALLRSLVHASQPLVLQVYFVYDAAEHLLLRGSRGQMVIGGSAGRASKAAAGWRLTLKAGRFSAGHCATSCSSSCACLPNMLRGRAPGAAGAWGGLWAGRRGAGRVAGGSAQAGRATGVRRRPPAAADCGSARRGQHERSMGCDFWPGRTLPAPSSAPVSLSDTADL